MKYLAVGAAVVIALQGAAVWWLYRDGQQQQERIGKLEHSNEQLTKAINAKTQATQSRAISERDARKLAPADKLERMR